MAEKSIGCGRPTGAVVGEPVPEENINEKEIGGSRFHTRNNPLKTRDNCSIEKEV